MTPNGVEPTGGGLGNNDFPEAAAQDGAYTVGGRLGGVIDDVDVDIIPVGGLEGDRRGLYTSIDVLSRRDSNMLHVAAKIGIMLSRKELDDSDLILVNERAVPEGRHPDAFELPKLGIEGWRCDWA